MFPSFSEFFSFFWKLNSSLSSWNTSSSPSGNWVIFPLLQSEFFSFFWKVSYFPSSGNWDLLPLWKLCSSLSSGKWVLFLLLITMFFFFWKLSSPSSEKHLFSFFWNMYSLLFLSSVNTVSLSYESYCISFSSECWLLFIFLSKFAFFSSGSWLHFLLLDARFFFFILLGALLFSSGAYFIFLFFSSPWMLLLFLLLLLSIAASWKPFLKF